MWRIRIQSLEAGPFSCFLHQGKKKKYPGAKDLLGWYGAMCQGQAISVLVRAHLETKDDRYFLTAAEEGVKVFNISSETAGSGRWCSSELDLGGLTRSIPPPTPTHHPQRVHVLSAGPGMDSSLSLSSSRPRSQRLFIRFRSRGHAPAV